MSQQTSEDHCTWHQFANSSMYCVFDGHGGTQCSRVAAALLEKSVQQMSQEGKIAPETISAMPFLFSVSERCFCISVLPGTRFHDLFEDSMEEYASMSLP